jgi:hypothetical protein
MNIALITIQAATALADKLELAAISKI